jgi:hypothetical protein
MRTLVALGGATAVSLIALSAANAQDCVNGYRTLGNETIVQCDDLAAGEFFTQDGTADAAAIDAVPVEEPMVTGPAPAATADAALEEPIVTGSVAPAPTVAPPLEYRENADPSAGSPPMPLAEEPIVTGSIAPAGQPLEARENRDIGNADVAAGAAPLGEPLPPAEEPMFTGSIAPAPETIGAAPEPGAIPAGAEPVMAREAAECRPGEFYMQQLEENDMPMPCPS